MRSKIVGRCTKDQLWQKHVGWKSPQVEGELPPIIQFRRWGSLVWDSRLPMSLSRKVFSERIDTLLFWPSFLEEVKVLMGCGCWAVAVVQLSG